MVAPRAVVNVASKRLERTATRPITLESQVKRTSVSHSSAAPRVNVARRQCSVAAKMPEMTNPTTNRATPTRCAHNGRRDGALPRS